MLPQRIVNAIQEAVTPDAILTLDAGNNRLWMTHYFKSLKAGTIFCPGGLAGMAWGPPAAVTAKLLNPDKPVVSVSGDGGFAMAAHVLSTAVQYQLPIAFVVMNNSLLRMISMARRENRLQRSSSIPIFPRSHKVSAPAG